MADTSKRGFASMNEDKQREIAKKGGKAAHEKGNAHEFTSEEAQEAGRNGGEAASEERAETGRQGGNKSRKSSDDDANEHRGHKRSKKDNDDEDEDDEDEMDNEEEEEERSTPGGTREQHAKAGRPSHKRKVEE
jgi:uncharacterized protein